MTIAAVTLGTEYYAWRVVYRTERYKDTLEKVLRLKKKTGLPASDPDSDEAKNQTTRILVSRLSVAAQ